MISFDTNILVYATASASDAKALRARDLIARAMRTEWTILLLQTLAEFANVAIRKAGIPSRTSEDHQCLVRGTPNTGGRRRRSCGGA
jgi:predicted nucleic acid-binding protein